MPKDSGRCDVFQDTLERLANTLATAFQGSGLLDNFERGTLTRRQLALSLADLVSGAHAAPEDTGLKANCGIGNSFFGIEQGDGQAATVDHY